LEAYGSDTKRVTKVLQFMCKEQRELKLFSLRMLRDDRLFAERDPPAMLGHDGDTMGAKISKMLIVDDVQRERILAEVLVGFVFVPPEWFLCDQDGILPENFIGNGKGDPFTEEALVRFAEVRDLLYAQRFQELASNSVLTEEQWRRMYETLSTRWKETSPAVLKEVEEEIDNARTILSSLEERLNENEKTLKRRQTKLAKCKEQSERSGLETYVKKSEARIKSLKTVREKAKTTIEELEARRTSLLDSDSDVTEEDFGDPLFINCFVSDYFIRKASTLKFAPGSPKKAQPSENPYTTYQRVKNNLQIKLIHALSREPVNGESKSTLDAFRAIYGKQSIVVRKFKLSPLASSKFDGSSEWLVRLQGQLHMPKMPIAILAKSNAAVTEFNAKIQPLPPTLPSATKASAIGNPDCDSEEEDRRGDDEADDDDDDDELLRNAMAIVDRSKTVLSGKPAAAAEPDAMDVDETSPESLPKAPSPPSPRPLVSREEIESAPTVEEKFKLLVKRSGLPDLSRSATTASLQSNRDRLAQAERRVAHPDVTNRFLTPAPTVDQWSSAAEISDMWIGLQAVAQQQQQESTRSPLTTTSSTPVPILCDPAVLLHAGQIALSSNLIPATVAQAIRNPGKPTELNYEDALVEALNDPTTLTSLTNTIKQWNDAIAIVGAAYGKPDQPFLVSALK
jgi:hypothetical protein